MGIELFATNAYLGTLRTDAGPLAVTRVKREQGRIWHWLDAPACRHRAPRCTASWTGTAGTC